MSPSRSSDGRFPSATLVSPASFDVSLDEDTEAVLGVEGSGSGSTLYPVSLQGSPRKKDFPTQSWPDLSQGYDKGTFYIQLVTRTALNSNLMGFFPDQTSTAKSLDKCDDNIHLRSKLSSNSKNPSTSGSSRSSRKDAISTSPSHSVALHPSLRHFTTRRLLPSYICLPPDTMPAVESPFAATKQVSLQCGASPVN